MVTSMRAAALRDMLTTLRRRWPALPVIIYPTAVQGDGAAAEIAQAIRAANARAEVDVLIVVRGGGSIEDLWAFNEEAVAEAVFESALPVVSGVGHETDFTICDFVADARAATPTAAAALVTPDRAALAHIAAALAQRARARRARRGGAADAAHRRLSRAGSRTPARGSTQQRRDWARWRRASRAPSATPTRCRAVRPHSGIATQSSVRAPLPQSRATRTAATALARAGRIGVDRIEYAGRGAGAEPRAPQPAGGPRPRLRDRHPADGRVVQDAATLAPGDAVELALARGRAGATITRPGSG